jgi:hypothetical protein
MICVYCRSVGVRNEPGARPANSRTRRLVKGGGAVIVTRCLYIVYTIFTN